MRSLLLALTLTACSGGVDKPGTTGDSGDPTGTPAPSEGWCAVQGVFNANCMQCHSAASALGGLDLETSPYTALVGVTSQAFGRVLVQPGDPADSLLYLKMSGSQGASEGDPMPPTGVLDAATVEIVSQWIADGASDLCDQTPSTPPTTEGVHPDGWEEPTAHGLATKLQTDADCRDCHGVDLEGGTSGVACGSCHETGWETNCTYCHGGIDNPSGAPPEDIDDNTDPDTITFPPHTEHVTQTRHRALPCTDCHPEPTTALTPGHLFDDDTPGISEVTLAAGLAASGTYSSGTCSNVYCHGDGRSDGDISATDGPRTCESCHTTGGLRGEHTKHRNEGVDCHDCHPDVDAAGISVPAQHVDGTIQIDLAGAITWNGSTCDGVCHFENHNNRRW